MELAYEFKFQGDKFSCDWLEEKFKRKTLIYCNEKKKVIVIEMTILCRTECD